jgi:hypothetical protein
MSQMLNKHGAIGFALTAVAIAAGSPVLADTVYSTGFEPPAYAPGQLAGQNNWFGASNAVVQTSTVKSGQQAVTFNPTAGQNITATPVSYNSAGKPDKLVNVSTDFLYSGASDAVWEALATFGNGGFINQIVVIGGTGQVCGLNPCGGPILTPGTWYNIAMQLDYSTSIVTDFVNGLAFSSGAFDDIPALSTTLDFVALGTNTTYGPLGDATASWDNLSVTAVPEPATWAMLLSGFVMLGLAVRRKAAALA